MNEHVAGEILAAYVDGTLANGPRRSAEAHLSRCRECREALAEVFAIGSRRVQVPPEFLEQALQAFPPRSDAASAAGGMEPIRVPARKALPLRLAFGVAAVMLVAVAVSYLFIGREQAGMPGIAEKPMAEPAVALQQRRTPVPAEPTVMDRGTEDATRRQAPLKARHGLETEKKRASGEAVPMTAPAPAPVNSTAPAEAAMKQERLRATDEADTMPLREQEGGAVGGIAAPPEKDRRAEAKLAAPAPDRDKGALPQKAKAQSQRLSGGALAGDAMQLFLAATGRAVAPRLLPADEWSQAPTVRIAGDATEDDLVAPRPLAAWDWLPAGMALEVTIAADGSVRAVQLLGEWNADAAEQAGTAAGKLLFSRSTLETRRAVLSRDPLN